MGIHNDGGSARVTLGDDPANIPGYVFDGTIGAMGDSAGMLGMAKMFIPMIYPGMSTINTMKGQYLDPKLRVYYRYNKETWNIQAGMGLGFLIAMNYFAYPSKVRSDYTFSEDLENAEMLFDFGWASAMSQGPITATRIPFP